MEAVSPLPDDVLELGRGLIPAPVFLVGCARSGTSIFGEALAAHPRVVYLFELSPMWKRLAPERDDHRLDAADVDVELARGVYEALAAEASAAAKAGGVGVEEAVVLEKNPKHVLRLPFLNALFPWGRFLHIIRDGRDAVASLMFRNRGDRWGHLEIPGWRDLLRRYPEENHVRCAHQWKDAVTSARRDAEGLEPGRYLEVRYEDLVSEPRVVVGRALEFVGLTADGDVDAFLGKIQNETRGSYHARKQVRHFVENHERRVGRYRENLSAGQLADVEAVCGRLLRELGY